MPTYDYVCPKCGTTMEKFHGMNEKPRVRCTACRSLARKQIGAGAGVLFKGSGFYQTDYRSSAYQASAKAEKSAATAPASPAPGAGVSTAGAKSASAEKPAAEKKAKTA